MGERTDGTWAAKQIGLSVPRQNGKSQLIVARALAGALLFGETKIVISAHQQDTARETFNKFLEMRDASPALQERIDERNIMRALNRESIRFNDGAFIQFKARSVSGGRGFSADCLLLDEAQILGMPAWVSINSTMSARPNPQVWLLGTPPTPEDNGEVFTSVRKAALGGKAQTLAWLEWAADRKDDPAQVATRAKANPAWDTRINHEIVQGEYETYPPDRFALDRLGIWHEADASVSPIPALTWDALSATDPPGLTDRPIALGVDRWHDGTTSVAAAWHRDGVTHVELVAVDVVSTTAGIVDWLADRAGRRIPVLIASDSPAGELVGPLLGRKVKVKPVSSAEFQRACEGFVNAALEKRLTHGSQKQLDDGVIGARGKDIGKAGAWAWDRSRPDVDISGLVAATLARSAAVQAKPKTGRVVTA